MKIQVNITVPDKERCEPCRWFDYTRCKIFIRKENNFTCKLKSEGNNTTPCRECIEARKEKDSLTCSSISPLYTSLNK